MSLSDAALIEIAFRTLGWVNNDKQNNTLQKIEQLNMLKAKILVLGPCESGKSAISNFLADATDTPGGAYRPTQGVRILEFESAGLNIGGRVSNAEVELWDCSGDRKFETCWPAMARDCNGLIFVFNPDKPNQDKELEILHEYFVHEQGHREGNCILFSHNKSQYAADDTRDEKPLLPASFSKIHCIKTNLDEDGESLREEFNTFLSSLFNLMSDKREQEELSIMNQ